MEAEIIAVGTELLLGQITNTNARYLSEKLAELGINVFRHTVIGDNAGRLAEAFRQALSRADLIILSGGLGPTLDDLTKETVAKVLDLPLETDRGWEEQLEIYFAKTRRSLPEGNNKQTLAPLGACLLYNDNGTAPGLWIEHGRQIIILLPGPPRELEAMFADKAMPRLSGAKEAQVIFSRVLKVFGLGEPPVEEAVADLVTGGNPTLAILAQKNDIHLRLTAKAGTREKATVMLDALERIVRERLGTALYGRDEETMETAVAALLLANKKTLATAESCTGGLLAHLLTNVPGSSAYFLQGTITYSNRAKIQMLKVGADLLDSCGAVSSQTAGEMARNMRRLAGSDLSLAISGIAGPGGATEQKPVGLVYIALAGADGVECKRFNFLGKRDTIKERAAMTAMDLLRLYLIKHGW